MPSSVLALRPDVVLVWPTGTPETTIERLRALGLNVVDVPTQSLADVPRGAAASGPARRHLAGGGAAALRLRDAGWRASARAMRARRR